MTKIQGTNHRETLNPTLWAHLFCIYVCKSNQRCFCTLANQHFPHTGWQIPAVRCLSPVGLSFLQTAGPWFPFSSSAYSQTCHPLNLGRSLAALYPNWKLWKKEALVTGEKHTDCISSKTSPGTGRPVPNNSGAGCTDGAASIWHNYFAFIRLTKNLDRFFGLI